MFVLLAGYHTYFTVSLHIVRALVLPCCVTMWDLTHNWTQFFLGALAMPRWASVSSVNTESTHTSSLASGKSIEQSLLTTCVGSVHELTELLACINTRPLTWTPPAIQALFYFMRCSQVKFYSNLFHYVYYNWNTNEVYCQTQQFIGAVGTVGMFLWPQSNTIFFFHIDYAWM